MNINLLVASDGGYVPHAVTALTSACENNRHNALAIYYLHAGLPESVMDGLRDHFERYSATIVFVRVDDAQVARFHTEAHLTSAAYYRVLCADLLPPEIDRVLYLDCDVVVEAALDRLYATDLRGRAVGAVRDAYLNAPKWQAHLKAVTGIAVPSYFNSGVMLIDPAAYRASRVGPAVVELLGRCSQHLPYADQDAFNVMLQGHWMPLHARWNLQSYWYTLDYAYRAATAGGSDAREVVAGLRAPGIVHYTTASKPWHFMNAHPRKQRYWHYRKATPFGVQAER